jgi:cyclohexyl-isocyanide hydratase
MAEAPQTTIVFLLFPGITQLDFTAPAQARCAACPARG